MSDDLRAAIEKFAGYSVYNSNPYIRGLASEYAKQEEKLQKLRVVSNISIEQLTELFLMGYTLTPPNPPRSIAHEAKWYRRFWRWIQRLWRRYSK